MGFGGKVHDHIRALLFEKIHDEFPVSNVSFYKLVVGLILHAFQCFQIACIRQSIQIDDFIFRILVDHVLNEVTADEPSASSD